MLIDDLIRVASTIPGKDMQVQALNMAVRFQIDNVARYVHEDLSEHVDKPLNISNRIPNVAPLAPVMWFEYSGLAIGQRSDLSIGSLVCIDTDVVEGISTRKYETAEPDTKERIRWILRTECFTRDHNHRLNQIGISEIIEFTSVDKDGEIICVSEVANGSWERPPSDFVSSNNWYEEYVIPLTAICFAHCKGAEVKEHQPSRQVRRHTERKGKPVYSYRTIDIGPASRVLSGEGNISQNGLGKALHICRGHFAHYTADKPLFGKHVGTFYKPMHLRGKADNGVVEKDYRVYTEAK